MDSASIEFVAFGMIVALVTNFSHSALWRSTVLLTSSIIFLVMLSPSVTALLPLFGFLCLGYAGLTLARMGLSKFSTISVVIVILAYVFLKKYTFLPSATFLQHPYLLLGLSYIFFRVLHLLIEAGENPEIRSISPFRYLLYTINFTTFVSGPIQRYDSFAQEQFVNPPAGLGVRTVGSQLERIVRGFFKVNVVAMLLHLMQEDALAHLLGAPSFALKLYAAFQLAIVYPIFLYANFSGYIDIVIALARLMRVRLPENFDRPFSASSALEFWNRWHMTLSNWLKTYVYNPLLLALMRRISSRSLEPFLGVICFFITFFLIGVWHGRTSEFVVFGVLTGGGMSINKLWQLLLIRRMGRKGYNKFATNLVYKAFGRGLNFAWFSFTLFWFWQNWDQLHKVFGALPAAQWLCIWIAVWFSSSAVLAIWEWLRTALLSIQNSEGPILSSRYARMVYMSAMGLAAFVNIVLLNQTAPDIVYKAF